MIGLFPSFVAGTMSKVQEVNLVVLFNDKLKYSYYIEKCISGKQFTIFFSHMKINISRYRLVKDSCDSIWNKNLRSIVFISTDNCIRSVEENSFVVSSLWYSICS